MEKMTNYLSIVWLAVGLFASCSDNKPSQGNTSKPTDPQGKKINAHPIYIAKCATCHGGDGKLGVGGAKNLAETKLSVDEIKHQIIHGKGAMPPFGNQLSQEEIQALATYVSTEIKGK